MWVQSSWNANITRISNGHISLLLEATVTWSGMLAVLYVLHMLIWPWTDPRSRSRSLIFSISANCTFLHLSPPPFWCRAQSAAFRVSRESRYADLSYDEANWPEGAELRDWVFKNANVRASWLCMAGLVNNSQNVSFKKFSVVTYDMHGFNQGKSLLSDLCVSHDVVFCTRTLVDTRFPVQNEQHY